MPDVSKWCLSFEYLLNVGQMFLHDPFVVDGQVDHHILSFLNQLNELYFHITKNIPLSIGSLYFLSLLAHLLMDDEVVSSQILRLFSTISRWTLS